MKFKLGVVIHTCNLSPGQTEGRGSLQVVGQPGSLSDFRARLSYAMKPGLLHK